MCGIYLHIPFCKQACHYCNFHFSTSLKLQNDFLQALLKEIELRKDYADCKVINTIYFGGGTPSLLKPEQLLQIISTLRNTYFISENAEITIEANPDDITREALQSWSKSGINRLSMGVQSFFEEDLRWMNRVHSATQAIDCIRLAKEEGFSNMTIDLIYGGPTLSDEKWLKNLGIATGLEIPHLSCYALTVESKTALDAMIRKKQTAAVNTEDQARQFNIMLEFLEARGYQQYEISNFSLPGKKSRHNSAYWSGEKYIGLGPSAHSFDGSSRQWNISNNSLYIQSLNNNQLPFEIEILTPDQKFNEYVMTSLRTMEGCSLNFVEHKFGRIYIDSLKNNAQQFIIKEWMKEVDENLILTKQGKLFADGIASDLFIVPVNA